MQLIENAVERRVQIYNAIVELKAAHVDEAVALSVVQRRLLVSRDEFYAALKVYYRVAGLMTDGAIRSATIDAVAQAEKDLEAYVQGETLTEH